MKGKSSKGIKTGELLFIIMPILFIIVILYFYFIHRLQLRIVIQTLGSIIGVLLGSYFGGRYAVNTINKQITYDRLKESKKETERLLKIHSFLMHRFDSLKLYGQHIVLFESDIKSGVRVKNLKEEYSRAINAIKDIKLSLNENNTLLMEFLNAEAFEKIQGIYASIGSVELEYSLYLYSEDPTKTDFKYLIQLLNKEIDKLQNYLTKNKERRKGR